MALNAACTPHAGVPMALNAACAPHAGGPLALNAACAPHAGGPVALNAACAPHAGGPMALEGSPLCSGRGGGSPPPGAPRGCDRPRWPQMGALESPPPLA